MTNPHLLEIDVAHSAIDENGHVNNVEYVRWMQEAAISHADFVGCSRATLEDGASWFARSHRIDYIRPAMAGDRVQVRTWVEGIRRASSIRRYEMVRMHDNVVLAKGETDWVYVDSSTGRPKSIPEHIRDLFE